MKKSVAILSVLIVSSFFLISKSTFDLLRIPEPGSALVKKRRILVNLDDLKSIIKKEDVKGKSLNVELATVGDYVIARLAKIKNNRVSYQHKIIESQYLLVNFGKEEYKELLRKVVNEPGALKYQIIFSDSSNKVIDSYPVTFSRLPDLSVVLKYPVNIVPGEPINTKLTVVAKNAGMEASLRSEAEILLSRRFNIPEGYENIIKSENIIRLKNATVTIPPLQPGEEKEISPAEQIVIPSDVSEGKYYFAAIIDPHNNLLELDEGNNLFEGFVMVETFEPKKVTMFLPDTELVYYPANFKLEIISNGLVISSGREWRKCNIKPYIFQIKHASWINFFWEIDTLDRSTWKITGAKFCKRGGTEKSVKAKVINFGGTKVIMPSKFKILLKDTKLVYAPKSRRFSIVSNGVSVAHPSFWQVCKIKPLKYHFKHSQWDSVFLELDPSKKTVKKVPLGFMCRKNDKGKLTDIKVEVEK